MKKENLIKQDKFNFDKELWKMDKFFKEISDENLEKILKENGYGKIQPSPNYDCDLENILLKYIEICDKRIKKANKKAQILRDRYENIPNENLTKHAGYGYGYWDGVSSALDFIQEKLEKELKGGNNEN